MEGTLSGPDASCKQAVICHDWVRWTSLSAKWGSSWVQERTGCSWADLSRVQKKPAAGLQGHLLALCLPKQVLPAEVLCSQLKAGAASCLSGWASWVNHGEELSSAGAAGFQGASQAQPRSERNTSAGAKWSA